MPVIGQTFTLLNSVDSTNNYAMAQVHAGLAKHGATFMAYEQTAGKGQRGRSWKSTPGENITMSVVLEPGFLDYPDQFYLSAAIALGCYDFFEQQSKGETSIKWPNDIYWRDRKAGGILIETILRGSAWKYAIAGIGLNLNQTEFHDITRAVSLKAITGVTREIESSTRSLCEALQRRYEQLERNKSSILHDYNQVLYKKNQRVRLKRENIVFETVIVGVDALGRLNTAPPLAETFSVGEVEWVF